jgi:hypothetical protein
MLETQKVAELAKLLGRKDVRHEDSYVNSIAYYILTGREKAKIYSDKRGFLATCIHPHKHNCLLVFPELGIGDGTLTVQAINNLKNESEFLQLARYTQKDYERLSHVCSKLNIAYEIKKIEEESLDWAFPALYISTGYVGEMLSHRLKRVRNKSKKPLEKVEIFALGHPSSLQAMKACLYFWVGGLISAGNEEANKRMEYYEKLLEVMKLYPFLFDGFVVFYNGEPAGFSVWDTSVEGVANSLASLSKRSIKGLSEFQKVTACQRLHAQGIPLYNLGGSENEALHKHKMKFDPVKSVTLGSYCLHFPSASSDLQEISLVA